MRLVATLVLLIAFTLVRPLAGQAEGLGPCMEAGAVSAVDSSDHAGMDHRTMGAEAMDHEMMDHGPKAPASESPASEKSHACASACCASPAVMAATGTEFVQSRQPAFLVAAVSPAATPVPHTPDLRPPIA